MFEKQDFDFIVTGYLTNTINSKLFKTLSRLLT